LIASTRKLLGDQKTLPVRRRGESVKTVKDPARLRWKQQLRNGRGQVRRCSNFRAENRTGAVRENELFTVAAP